MIWMRLHTKGPNTVIARVSLTLKAAVLAGAVGLLSTTAAAMPPPTPGVLPMSPADVTKIKAIYKSYVTSDGRRTIIPYHGKDFVCVISFVRTNVFCAMDIRDPRAPIDPLLGRHGYTEKFVAKRPETCVIVFRVHRGDYDAYVTSFKRRIC